jgi:hypothetical protein
MDQQEGEGNKVCLKSTLFFMNIEFASAKMEYKFGLNVE